MSATPERLVIIGAGPAGYTAAIYAARAMLKPLLLSGFEPGGQLMITTDVENYPGFADAVQGPWLMEQFRAQAEHVGARLENEHVTDLDLSRRPFRIACDSGRVIEAQTVILATGAKAKWLGLPGRGGVQGLWRLGLRDLRRILLPRQERRRRRRRQFGGRGGALPLAIAASVTVVHRRDSFRAERILIDRLARAPECIRQVEPHGRGHRRRRNAERRHRVLLRDVATGALEEIATDGVFVAIGHAPADRAGARAGRAEAQRLCADGAELDGDQRRGPVRRRRRRRRRLSAGGHRRGARLHGGAGGRPLARRSRLCDVGYPSPAIIA